MEFTWRQDQQDSFQTLKNALFTAPVLAFPNYNLPMIIIPDACGYGIGAVLAQIIDGQEHPIAYASRLLSKAESNYSITEQECLALIWSIQKFRSLVWGCQLTVVTDHQALCWLMTKKDLAGRLARWSLSLQEYDIKIVYRSGKLHDNADCLSRNPRNVIETDEDRCLPAFTTTASELNKTESSKIDQFLIAQRQVQEWKKAIAVLRSGGKIKNFSLINNKLYTKTIKNNKAFFRLCVPKQFRQQILTAYHDDSISSSAELRLYRLHLLWLSTFVQFNY